LLDIPPQGTLGATNANAWVYGLFELGIVIAFVLVVTLPFWADRFINWFQRLFDSAKQETDK
jgi:hypothetical protein